MNRLETLPQRENLFHTVINRGVMRSYATKSRQIKMWLDFPSRRKAFLRYCHYCFIEIHKHLIELDKGRFYFVQLIQNESYVAQQESRFTDHVRRQWRRICAKRSLEVSWQMSDVIECALRTAVPYSWSTYESESKTWAQMQFQYPIFWKRLPDSCKCFPIWKLSLAAMCCCNHF